MVRIHNRRYALGILLVVFGWAVVGVAASGPGPWRAPHGIPFRGRRGPPELWRGARGPQGATGPTGPAGDPGPDGTAGANGAQGATGPQGAAGVTGGGTGDQGATGPQGDPGIAGARGATGAQGAKGAQGPTGAQGAAGAAGAQGAQGAKGGTGAQGATGTPGTTGAQGAKGDQGAQGVAGAKGATGAQGAQGEAGLNGGATGPQGAKGATGAQGAAGAAGAQGATGAQGAAGAPGITGATGAAGTNGSLACPGNTVCVDQVFGNDATCVPSGAPCLTIAKAISIAQAGQAVRTAPGVYNEGPLVMKSDVDLIGADQNSVIVQRRGLSAATLSSLDMLTMAPNANVRDLTILADTVAGANGHLRLRGVVFAGTTAANAQLRRVTISLNNSLASVGGTSEVVGILSNGTGVATVAHQAISDSLVVVVSAGLGRKRGLLATNPTHTLNVGNLNARVSGVGAGSFIGVEVAGVIGIVPTVTLRDSTIDGQTSDVSRTLGTLRLGSALLVHSTANHLAISTIEAPNQIVWGTTTPTAATSLYLYRGTTVTGNAALVSSTVPQTSLVYGLQIRVRVAATTSSYQARVYRNGVATSLGVTLVATTMSASNLTQSVTFSAGDTIALLTTAFATVPTDVQITVETY